MTKDHEPTVTPIRWTRHETWLLAALILVAVQACNSRRAGPDGGPGPDAARQTEGPLVDNMSHLGRRQRMSNSLIELIAHPERFRGQNVRVTGYLAALDPEAGQGSDGWLYLGKEDAEWGLPNAVHVKFGPCRYTPTPQNLVGLDEAPMYEFKYVIVEGVFEPAREGSVEALVGVICGITRVALAPQFPLRHVPWNPDEYRRDGGSRGPSGGGTH